MIRIDKNCIYVPEQYEGRIIRFVESGGRPEAGYAAGQAVRCPSGGAWVNHTRNPPKSGHDYDVYAWGPNELIGSTTAE